MLANRSIKRAQFGQCIFVLGAIAFIAVGFLGTGRVLSRCHFVERQHRHEMFDAGELLARRATDALGRRFGGGQLRKRVFQLLQLAKKLVVFVVGDELLAGNIIGMVMPVDLGDQFGVALLGVSVCHPDMMRPARRKGNHFWQARWLKSLSSTTDPLRQRQRGEWTQMNTEEHGEAWLYQPNWVRFGDGKMVPGVAELILKGFGEVGCGFV